MYISACAKDLIEIIGYTMLVIEDGKYLMESRIMLCCVSGSRDTRTANGEPEAHISVCDRIENSFSWPLNSMTPRKMLPTESRSRKCQIEPKVPRQYSKKHMTNT